MANYHNMHIHGYFIIFVIALLLHISFGEKSRMKNSAILSRNVDISAPRYDFDMDNVTTSVIISKENFSEDQIIIDSKVLIEEEFPEMTQEGIEEIENEIIRSWDYIANYFANQQRFFYVFILFVIMVIWSDWEKLPFIMGMWDPDMPEDEDEFPTAVSDGKKFIFPGELFRPLERMEVVFGMGGFLRSYGTNQAIWIRSKNPINETVMAKAIRTLTRQYPQLQLCFARKGLKLWFKRMKKIKIDFTAVKGDGIEEYEKVLSVNYDYFIGPLWKVKLVTCPPMTNQPESRNYKAVLIFSIHHSITDAMTNNLVCRETVRLYNTLILGGSIAPIPVPLSPSIDDSNPSLTTVETICTWGKMLFEGLCQKWTIKCISPKWYGGNRTKIQFDQLTENETSSFISNCKHERVSVNSCIVTASAFAFVKTIKSFSSSSSSKMDVSIAQAVNLRRYLEPKKELNGCYISIINTLSKVDIDDKNSFWEEARRMQTIMTENINSQYPLTYASLYNSIWALQLLSILKRLILLYENSQYHFVTTNMNDMSDQLPVAGKDDCIEVFDVLRSVSGNHQHAPFFLTFHTFRKVMKFSIDFYTNRIKEGPAKAFFHNVMENIRFLSQTGSLPR